MTSTTAKRNNLKYFTTRLATLFLFITCLLVAIYGINLGKYKTLLGLSNMASMKSKDFQILIGNRIQELRLQKGLTQVDLVGKMMGNIDTTNISRIEKGRINTSAFMLYRIAIALDITLKELLDIEFLENDFAIKQS